MSNINAAIGLVQLKKIDHFIKRRRDICHLYDDAFKNYNSIKLLNISYDEIAPFYYIVRVPKYRKKFMSFLEERGVGTGVHYIANHMHSLFSKYSSNHLPRTNKLWKEIVTIPLHCEMSDNDVRIVINSVKAFEKEKF